MTSSDQIARKPRSPAVAFDEIPGTLPNAVVPADANLETIAQTALVKLNGLRLSGLTANVIWRDFLSFTGTYRTFYSAPTVFDTFKKLSNEKQCSVFRLNTKFGSGFSISKSGADCSWVDVNLLFSTHAAGLVTQCAGIVSVILGPDGKWVIWMLRTWMECIDGHGNPDKLDPGSSPSSGMVQNAANVAKPDKYDAIVVGGGQAGLAVSGRLKALGLRYVLLEKTVEIGDVWKNRYESLRWHTSKEYGCLPFGHRYAEEEDYNLPTARIAANHKLWAEKYGLNYRTSTIVEKATWNDVTHTWTVSASGPDGPIALEGSNLILGIGTGHATPVSPAWASPEKIQSSGFKGTIIHGSSYKSCRDWAGKRGIVVGTANTAHDVAEDMANAGMSATMVQRNATFVFPAEWLHRAEDVDYHRGKHTDLADRDTFTYPNKIMRDKTNRIVWTLIEHHPDRFDALERAGFKLERYGDIYNNLYVRFGGHYVDIGCSARIANGEIGMRTQAVKGLTTDGLMFEDGSEEKADLIVLCTGFDHDFRKDAGKIVGKEVADQMDDYWSLDKEGEMRAHAKIAGHPHLYYHGGDVRMTRFFSRFIALSVQADALGKPMELYLD